MTTKHLSIDLIITDAGTQMRVGTRLETVKEYAEIAAGKEWRFDTPITVFFDGSQYYLADGFHRHEACVMAGRASVLADVRDGSLRDAITFALGANQCHGLRRSNDDKRAAVQFALADAEWSQWSSRAIADLVGVGPALVDTMRNERIKKVPLKGTSEENEVPKRIGKDGKQYPVKPKAEPVADIAEDEYEDVDDEPETVEAKSVTKPEPTKAEHLSKLRSVAKQYNVGLMRTVDEMQSLSPKPVVHERMLERYRGGDADLGAWK